MEKILKQFITKLIVLITATAFVFTGTAFAVESNNEFIETKKDYSNEALAYHDVATGTETLFTTDEIKKEFSIDVKKVSRQAPQKPTEEIIEKKLTKKQKEVIVEAQRNSSEYDVMQPMERFSEVTESDQPYISQINASLFASVDNRTQVSNENLKKFPYYSTCKIIGDGQYFSNEYNYKYTGFAQGTGFAVGNRLCATARHVITDDYGNWLTDLQAYYGYNGVSDTYTTYLNGISGYIYYPQYITGYNSNGTIQIDWNYDIAFVIWDKKTVNLTGSYGMSSGINVGTEIKTAGYPNDLPANENNRGLRMYETFGTVSYFTNEKIWCDNMYIFQGQSGSPLYNSDNYALGVLTHTGASGRRFNSELIQWIKEEGFTTYK